MQRRGWTATLAWILLILVAGAALATWGLSRWDSAARFLGVAPRPSPPVAVRTVQQIAPARPQPAASAEAARIAELETRLRAVENTSRRAAGSVGRADALLVAFATRRAIDRGVPLGYLETLLADRFGAHNPRAVASIITASRDPVTLDQLIAEYETLSDALRAGAPDESLWQGLRREFGSLVAVRRASAPSGKPQARYERALAQLHNGRVDAALAETMRLPGAAHRPRGQVLDPEPAAAGCRARLRLGHRRAALHPCPPRPRRGRKRGPARRRSLGRFDSPLQRLGSSHQAFVQLRKRMISAWNRVSGGMGP